jgi:hypothetical protein
MTPEHFKYYEKGQSDLLDALEPVLTGKVTLQELAPTLQEMLAEKKFIKPIL